MQCSGARSGIGAILAAILGCSSPSRTSHQPLALSEDPGESSRVAWRFAGVAAGDSLCDGATVLDVSAFGRFDGDAIELHRETFPEWIDGARKEWTQSHTCSDARTDPTAFGSVATLLVPNLSAARVYSLRFDAYLVSDTPGSTAPALLRTNVAHRINNGAFWSNSFDRFYVTETPTTFSTSVNAYSPQWGRATDLLAPKIVLERWSSGRNDASIRIENIRIVEGALQGPTAKVPFDGAQTRFDEEGNWRVSSAGDSGRVWTNFFPISINATQRDAEYVGQHLSLSRGLAVPVGVAASDFFREVGWAYFADSGFTVVKVTSGYWTEMARIRNAGLYAYAGVSTAIRTDSLDFGLETVAEPAELTALVNGATPASGYEEGLLAFWFDWEDHKWFTDFSAWDSFYWALESYQNALYGQRAVPLVVTRGVMGAGAIVSGRADGMARYVSPSTGNALSSAGELPASMWRSGDAVSAPWVSAVRLLDLATVGSPNHDPRVQRAMLWDAVAAGAKGVHHFGYAVSDTGGLCEHTSYEGYFNGSLGVPPCLRADDPQRFPGLWETFREFHDSVYGDGATQEGLLPFIAASAASWTPVLDSVDQRYGSVSAKEVEGVPLMLVTNIASATRTPVLRFSVSDASCGGGTGEACAIPQQVPRRIRELVLGSLSRERANVEPWLNGASGSCQSEVPVTLGEYDQKVFAIDFVDAASVARAFVARAVVPARQGLRSVTVSAGPDGSIVLVNGSSRPVRVSLHSDAGLFTLAGARVSEQDLRPGKKHTLRAPCARRVQVSLVGSAGANLVSGAIHARTLELTR